MKSSTEAIQEEDYEKISGNAYQRKNVHVVLTHRWAVKGLEKNYAFLTWQNTNIYDKNIFLFFIIKFRRVSFAPDKRKSGNSKTYVSFD